VCVGGGEESRAVVDVGAGNNGRGRRRLRDMLGKIYPEWGSSSGNVGRRDEGRRMADESVLSCDRLSHL